MVGFMHDEIVLEVPEERAEQVACMLLEIIAIMGCELPHHQSMLSLPRPICPFDCQKPRLQSGRVEDFGYCVLPGWVLFSAISCLCRSVGEKARRKA